MTWYKELFASEDPVRFSSYGESDASRHHVDFLVEKLELVPGMKILDLCCGQGRHLLELTRRGYDVVGVDLSAYMLSKCREAAESIGIGVNLIQSDMRDIDFDSEFDAVINMFTSFGYLESDEEDQKVLNAVSRSLKPGGVFFLDTVNRDSLMSRFQERSWSENERGDITVIDRSFDSLAGRINCRERTIFTDGHRSSLDHSFRLYCYTELAKMLNIAGLHVTQTFGNYDGSDFGRISKGMFMCARKDV